MRAKILGISTVVPKFKLNQSLIADLFEQQFEEGSPARRIIRRIYQASEIESRYSVIGDLIDGNERTFFTEESGKLKTPSTGFRNDFYIKHSSPLWIRAANEALQKSGVSADDITHLITVSCTGFFAPGPDFLISKSLGLTSNIERTHIGFMGCYAAFPALRQANHIVRSHPEAKVLIVCLELCTLHVQFSEATDSLLSGSVFADGAAGLVVATEFTPGRGLILEHSESTLVTEGENEMAWKIGDQGFDMILSNYVPKILSANIKEIFDGAISKIGKNQNEISRWAIHPGGRLIVDKIQDALSLSDADTRFSRNVLKDFGNMSSATILFVLNSIWDESENEGELIYATAFGPGLTVESAFFEVA